MRRRPHTPQPANARVVQAVVFAGDPTGDPHREALTGEIAHRLQGGSGHAYIGDKGAPERSFNGPLATSQTFLGASTTARNAIVWHDAQGRDIATGVNADGPMADVSSRMFALRMARRSPL